MSFTKLLPLLFAAATMASASSLVTNGDFTTDCGGWNASDVDGSFCQNGSGLGPGNPGGFAVLNNGPAPTPSMWQDIAGLVVGNLYQLTWDMKNAYGCCGSAVTPDASVEIDGNTWEFIVPIGQNWTPYSEIFTYLGGSNTLRFTSQIHGTDGDVGLDNVTLTDLGAPPSEAPEPSTFLLMAAGAGLAYHKFKA